MADLFFILNNADIASYVDDNTPYVIADDISGVITSLEKASKLLFEWFKNNLLKGNADKCHLLVSSSDAVNLRVSEYDIKNSKCEKLLSVKFDNKLTLEKHITDMHYALMHYHESIRISVIAHWSGCVAMAWQIGK